MPKLELRRCLRPPAVPPFVQRPSRFGASTRLTARMNQWTTRKAAEAAILGTFDTALEAAAACARAVGGGGLWGEQRRRFRNYDTETKEEKEFHKKRNRRRHAQTLATQSGHSMPPCRVRSSLLSPAAGAAHSFLSRTGETHACSKKEGGWRQEVTPHPERRRRRVCGPRVVARRLLRGAADHRTARRRPVRHAPPSTRLLPHERPQRRNFSLALPWAPGNADGLPVPPPAPQSPP